MWALATRQRAKISAYYRARRRLLTAHLPLGNLWAIHAADNNVMVTTTLLADLQGSAPHNLWALTAGLRTNLKPDIQLCAPKFQRAVLAITLSFEVLTRMADEQI